MFVLSIECMDPSLLWLQVDIDLRPRPDCGRDGNSECRSWLALLERRGFVVGDELVEFVRFTKLRGLSV